MTLNTFTSGADTNFSGKLNDNFNASGKVLEIYSGTGFDNSSNTFSYTAAEIAGADYIKIELGLRILANDTTSFSSTKSAGLTIKTAESGGTLSNSLSRVEIWRERKIQQDDYVDRDREIISTFSYYHTLTSLEKSSGVDIEITTDASGSSLENVQTCFLTAV
jgi:hypothetical protein